MMSQMYIKFPLLDKKMNLIFGDEADPKTLSVYQ